MKVVVCVRTRDNADIIGRFCYCYRWADRILIADGGSVDNTKQIASTYSNVEVMDFPIKEVYGERWRNPFGKHFNFLMAWARSENPDWIIFDDSDCVPSSELQVYGKSFLVSYVDAVYVERIYIKGDTQYYPQMNEPGASLWAWKASSDVYADEEVENKLYNIPSENVMTLYPPYGLLHYFYPDEKTIQGKLDLYKATGELGNVPLHPNEHMGQLKPIEGWMTWI